MSRQVSRTELVALLKQKQALNAEQSVVISADKNVRYEEVINVMDILQKQQIKKVGLLVQTKGTIVSDEHARVFVFRTL